LPRIPGLEVQKLASILPAESLQQLYGTLARTWPRGPSPVLSAGDVTDEELFGAVPGAIVDGASQMMFLDLVTYLPDDILVKLDRASMAVSLEARVPMLDHRVVELAWEIAPELKIRQGVGKWILRQVLQRHVPPALTERAKAGFGIPIGSWLRGPLRPWAESLLARERLDGDGYFRSEVIRATWEQHLSGRVDLADRLWAVLVFQSWLDAYPTTG
jgi:asparagine synthase (glutamine-hydrolysing)